MTLGDVTSEPPVATRSSTAPPPPAAPSAAAASSTLADRLRPILILVGVVAIWQGYVWASGITPFILPGPDRVALTLWSSADVIASNALVTIAEVLAGLALGTALGALTAIQLVAAPALGRMVMPVLVFSQAIPFFALAPLLVIWLGFGMASKIAMATLIIYFPVTAALHDGLNRTDPGLIDLARVMGASPARILWHLRLPAALPAFGTGLRLATVYAPVGAVIGEWVGGAQGGLGYLMLLANGRSKIDLMFACLVVLAVFTVLLYALIDRVAKRLDAIAAGER
ncbi:MAG: ABC transporter permease [Pseudomonadota bacterium]